MNSWNSTRLPAFKLGASVGLCATYIEISDLAHPGVPANDNYLWAVDDGVLTKVLALNKATAANAGDWTVTGFTASDLESLASFSLNSTHYLALGDTGNNANAADSRGTGIDLKVARCKEPTITGSAGTISGANVEIISCVFPAGNAPSLRDCETMLADPQGNLYFITKRITPVKVYQLPYAASYTGIQTLSFLGNMTSDAGFNTISSTPSGNNGYATGGCISPNGREIIVRNYERLYRWARVPGESIITALQRAPDAVLSDAYVGGGLKCTTPNQEPQGEAITFDRRGHNLYHTSEYVAASAVGNPPLFRMDRLATRPTVASFQQGTSSYTGCTDTYLDSTNPTTSFATAIALVCDYDYSAFPTTSRTRQSLLKFDLTSIASSATVVGAYLDFYISAEGIGLWLHKMLVTWADSATYTSFTGGVSANDVEAALATSATVGDDATATVLDGYLGFIRVNLTAAEVQGWISNSATNFGWLINAVAESSGDGIQIDSAEGATVSRRPKLTVMYLP